MDRYIEQQQQQRIMPSSELDLQMLTIDSVWGKPEVSMELKNMLMRLQPYKDENGLPMKDKDGKPVFLQDSLWGMLGYFTRDMRLANLSSWDNELQTCRFYIDLANDMLLCGMLKPFLICLSRAACILETSQSKGGFLRRLFNTFRKEEYTQQLEPPKKGFFGGKKEGM